MTMSPGLRRVTLTLHLTSSVGWIGAVAAFVALAVVGVSRQDAQQVRAAYVAMSVLVSYIIVPFAFGGLLTGLISSLGTTWGLFRHYWVLLKLIMTTVAIAILLVQVEPIRRLAALAADTTTSVPALPAARRPLIHAAGGLLVLVVIQVLGVYKPRGMTRYGWRKQFKT
jgi:hypothetical protein